MPRRPIPLERFLRTRYLRRAPIPVVIVLILAALIFADRSGLLLERGDDWSRFHGRAFFVHRVVDGDTIDIMIPGLAPTKENLTRVRFWAIDTPEMARGSQAAQPFAEEATALTRTLCEERIVTLELESHSTRDRYGRLLAFIILEDGRCLNSVLVEEGLARVERRFSHSRMEEYETLEREATARRRGLWGGGN